MPKIPVYQEQVALRAQGVQPNARGASFLSVAPGLNAVSGTLEKIERQQEADARKREIEEKRLADETKRQEIEAAKVWAAQSTSEFDLQEFKNLTDAKTGVAPGAADFEKTYLDGYDKRLTEWRNKAPNAYARQMFDAHAGRSREAYGKDAYAFQVGERERYMVEGLAAGVQASAQLVRSNPALFDSEVGKYHMTMQGLNPRLRQAAHTSMVSTLAGEAVDGFIEKNPNEALGFLEHWRKQHAPGDPSIATMAVNGQEWRVPIGMLKPDQIDRTVAFAKQKNAEFKAGGFASVVIEAAQQGVAGSWMGEGDIADIPSATAKAVEIAESRLGKLTEADKQKVRTQVEHQAAQRERDIARQREANMAAMQSELFSNGGDYQALVKKNSWIAHQPQEWRARLNDMAGKISRRETIETDYTAFARLLEKPEELKTVNLDAVRDRFAKREFDQLKTAQAELNKPIGEQTIMSTKEAVVDIIDGVISDKTAQTKFVAELQERINTIRGFGGERGKMSQADIRALASSMLEKLVTNPGAWFGGNKRSYQITIADVPPKDRGAIEAALRDIGVEPTDRLVVMEWTKKLQRKD